MVGLTYFALSILLISFLSAIGCIPDGNPLTSAALYVALVLGGSSAWILAREVRRDLYQLCTFWLFFGVVSAVGSLLLSSEHRLTGWGLACLSLVTWVASLVVLAHAHLARDGRPNELLKRFSRDRVFEHAGVQIAVEPPDAAALAEGIFDVRIFVQNCWDAERTASISLAPRRGFAQVPGGAEFANRVAPLRLQGGEVGVLSIPVAVTSADRVRLYVELRTSGAGGRRIWRRPAQTIPMNVSPLATVLLAILSLGNIVAWGGGLVINVPPGTRKTRGLTLPEQRWHQLRGS